MIKKSIMAASIIAAFFLITSCSKVTDIQITTLEKSIEKLENNYRDMTSKELDAAKELIDKQIDKLDEKKDNGDLTKNQSQQLFELKARYVKVKILIALPFKEDGSLN